MVQGGYQFQVWSQFWSLERFWIIDTSWPNIKGIQVRKNPLGAILGYGGDNICVCVWMPLMCKLCARFLCILHTWCQKTQTSVLWGLFVTTSKKVITGIFEFDGYCEVHMFFNWSDKSESLWRLNNLQTKPLQYWTKCMDYEFQRCVLGVLGKP